VPKLTKHPRLRVHVRKGKDGRVYTYYFYDMRGEGVPDIALGKDREDAIAQWDELHNNKPRIKGTLEEAFLKWEQEKLPEYTNAETRRGYAKSLKWLRKAFKTATWDATTLVYLVEYLRGRKGKTQANREMALLSVIWNNARLWGMTTLPWPAAGMERSKWKNKESAREFEVTDALFDAVYAEAGQMLRDCMDLSTATGMRLTDCRTILLPADNILHLKASKTQKRADFDLSLSQVLPDLLRRRRAIQTSTLMLLVTEDGYPVFGKDLRREYDKARSKAAAKAREQGQDAFALEIEAMVLRDMRKRAADLADDLAGASKLLQHSSEALTQAHYRTRATKLKPVR
jgi:hypothetical protein